ncbi:MAG: dethiobiotin synthase, partial [Nitrospirae bacterium]|nr:dethiobiotin synthase [Nitrospirota bacterium]
MKGIFITGTGTGVGKTVVSALVIRTMIKRGLRVGAMKPIETGCHRNAAQIAPNTEKIKSALIPSDGFFLKEIADMDDPIDLVSPICLEFPLAPMAASRQEGRPISRNKIIKAYKTLAAKYEFLVVEGAGGLLVPIMSIRPISNVDGLSVGSSVYYVIDLIKEMALPMIIVAKNTLGTINHTLLTVECALRNGLDVLGIVLNHPNPPDNSPAEKTNPDVIREICPVPLLATLPHLSSISVEDISNAADFFENVIP